MNIKKITITILGVALLAGCASLEERLASNDPATKREAELELISQSRRSPNQGDRIAAINRVTDQEVLLVVATSAQGAYVPDGLAALAKLNGENTFVAVVNSAQDAQVRKAAFDKVNNQEVFEKLSVGASDPSIRVAAFDKLTSQEAILKIAGQSTDRAIRISAIDKVTDKSKLLPIVFKKVAAKPFASKEDIQKAMMTIMRDRRMSEDEKKQKIAQLSAMAKGGEPTIDNAVVDAFVAKCKDKTVLLKMIADYGEVLTTDQCAKIVTNNSDSELKNAIATIADKKIYAEVLPAVDAAYNYDGNEKYFGKMFSLSSGELKAKLIAVWVNKMRVGEYGIPDTLDKLLKSLNGEGVATLVNLLKDGKACYVADRFSEGAICEAIKYADKFDNLWALAELAKRVGKSSEVKELFHQNPDWGFAGMYKAITDSDTAEYVLLHMTGKKLEKRVERKEVVCYLFDQLNDGAISNVMRKIPEWEFFEVYNKVANPELAEYLFDKLTFSSLKEFEAESGESVRLGCADCGGTISVGLQATEILCKIIKQLGAAKKHKLLEIAEANIAHAKTSTVVFEKFYIGMPLVDYIVQSDYLKMKWLNIKDYRVGNPISLAKRFRNDSDLKNSITVESFEFDQKERYKIFKTEGDIKGILAFVQKYCKNDADVRDIQYDTNLWWRFTDDAHELKVFVHCRNGALKIESF